jgi:hypothetical protein
VLAELVALADFRLLAVEQAGADARAQAHRPELWADNAGASYTAHISKAAPAGTSGGSGAREERHWLRKSLRVDGWRSPRGVEDLLCTVEALTTEGTAIDSSWRTGRLPEGRPVAEVAAKLGEIITHIEAEVHSG